MLTRTASDSWNASMRAPAGSTITWGLTEEERRRAKEQMTAGCFAFDWKAPRSCRPRYVPLNRLKRHVYLARKYGEIKPGPGLIPSKIAKSEPDLWHPKIPSAECEADSEGIRFFEETRGHPIQCFFPGASQDTPPTQWYLAMTNRIAAPGTRPAQWYRKMQNRKEQTLSVKGIDGIRAG